MAKMFVGRIVTPVRGLATSTAFRSKEKDLIAEAFLKQIRDLATKQKAAGGLVNTSPEIKKALDEQLNRLANKFKLANADVVAKLKVDFEKPQVESQIAGGLEGKTLDQLLAGVKAEEAAYKKQREAKKKLEKERQAALSGGAKAKKA
uniref:ATP synthase-coupling factor 6, mitochondrial n=1 Tax=Panagrellus redivivus TaxID=6233 RepID=A0A7E4V118_PANRE